MTVPLQHKPYKRKRVPNDRDLIQCLQSGYTVSDIAQEFGKKKQAVQMAIFRLREVSGAKTNAHLIYIVSVKPSFDEQGFWRCQTNTPTTGSVAQ